VPPTMETKSVAAVLASAGAVLVTVGIFSKYIKKYASLPLAAILLGIIAGPYALNIIPPLKEVTNPGFVLEASRIALAIALIAIALKATPENFKKHWKSGTILLILGMLSMWAASSVVAYLILPLNFLHVLLIGAIVTPTVPVVLIGCFLLRELKGFKDRLFVGWFGPMGISTLFYALHAMKKLDSNDTWILASLVISLSAVFHGV
jgi:NhaP-type Na+/H+ or K+/H+ antiporter